MKRMVKYSVVLASIVLLTGCSEKKESNSKEAAQQATAQVVTQSNAVAPVKADDVNWINATGSGLKYLKDGWSAPEKDFSWTGAKKATMIIPLDQTLSQSDLVLRLPALPFISGQITKQTLVLSVNGKEIGRQDIIKAGEYDFNIPKEIASSGTLNITLDLPDAASPAQLKTGSDLRTLALCINYFKIVKK